MIYLAICLCFLCIWLLHLWSRRSTSISIVRKQGSKQRESRLSSTGGCDVGSNSAKQIEVTETLLNLDTSSSQPGCAKQWRKKKGRVIYEYTEVQTSAHRDTELLCSRCVTVRAKPACSYKQCGRCCRGNPQSVCLAHGMGALVADAMVEKAFMFQPLELDLSYQQLKACPVRLPELGNILVTLNLSNNRLMNLPLDLGCLCCVEELFLQYNCLTKLPQSIGQMTRLYELDVKNNRLTELPDTIGNLTHLVILSATNNMLKFIPNSIGCLTSLQELCLHSNRLKELPDTLSNLRELESLYLGENRLQVLPARIGCIRQLTEMDLSGCELKLLPDSICNCSSLTKFWACSNRLISLPAQMGRLASLKELHVRRNQIRAFPASMARLHVYTFSAYNNPLLDEYNKSGLRRLTKEPKEHLPPLLELSARAVYNHCIKRNVGSIPRELEALLSSVKTCSSCGGPFFFHFKSNVFFFTVGVFHRVPLLQQLCSPHANVKCRPIQPDN